MVNRLEFASSFIAFYLIILESTIYLNMTGLRINENELFVAKMNFSFF